MLTIPNTDLKVSRIGLGTAKAGVTYAEADELIRLYLSLGGNLIDTARVYSDWIPGEIGRSERVIGEAIARLGVRDRVVLMTKGGHPDVTKGFDMHRSRMRAADMQTDLELSLRALKTDVIDIYVYHRDDEKQEVAALIEVMEDFRRAGKIRYYACSNWSAERMREADLYCRQHGYRGFIADQSLLNAGVKAMNPPLDDTLTVAAGPVYDYHLENPENLLMPFSGAAEGFFHRYLLKGEGGGVYHTEGNRKLAERIRELCREHGASVTQILMSYFSTLPIACVPLFGPKDAEQLKDAMTEVPLKAEDFLV